MVTSTSPRACSMPAAIAGCLAVVATELDDAQPRIDARDLRAAIATVSSALPSSTNTISNVQPSSTERLHDRLRTAAECFPARCTAARSPKARDHAALVAALCSVDIAIARCNFLHQTCLDSRRSYNSLRPTAPLRRCSELADRVHSASIARGPLRLPANRRLPSSDTARSLAHDLQRTGQRRNHERADLRWSGLNAWCVDVSDDAECVLRERCCLLCCGVAAAHAQATAGYTVKPGDMLEISVWKEPDLQRTVLVRPDGAFSFPAGR